MFSFSLNDFVLVWMSLLYEALPFVALGSIISGLVETFVSREAVVRWMPRRRVVGIIASAFLGTAFPMCECGIVPVVRRLVLKGVPASCAVTYMLAAPIVHPLVIVSTLIAFRGQGAVGMTILRVGAGVSIAVFVGLAVWRLLGDDNVFLETPEPSEEGGEDTHEPGPAGHAPRRMPKVVQALQTSAEDFVTFSVFLIAGTAIAALINSGFSRAAIAPVAEHRVGSIMGFMLLAVLLNVCSEADAFIAASFRAFSVAAKLSFIVLGPMFDIKLLLMFTAVFRRRAIVVLCTLMILSVFILCVVGGGWMTAFVGALPR